MKFNRQKKKYIFLAANLITSQTWERFGCAYFESRGYDVLALDCVDAIWPKKSELLKSIGAEVFKKGIAVKSKAELIAILKSIKEEDIILLNIPLDKESAYIYRIIGDLNLNYSVANFGLLPLNVRRYFQNSLSIFDYFVINLSQLGALLSRCRFLLGMLASQNVKYYSLPPPSFWLRSGEKASYLFSYFPKPFSVKKIIDFASFDYESSVSIETNKILETTSIVFLDDGMIGHPDYCHAGVPQAVTSDNYSSSMNKFFTLLERKIGKRVLIAGNPKAYYALNPYDREIIYGKTAELVRDSSLVVAHCSTAISYAVIFRKPILFVTTNELEHSDFRETIARVSSWLGRKRFNVDKCSEVPESVFQVDECLYATYERAFIKPRKVIAGKGWQKFESEVMKLLEYR